MNKVRIKKGDTVKIISGKDKGKTGKVLQVIPSIRKIIVENINLHTRFERSKKAGQPGKKVEFSSPFPVSKAMIIDSNSGQTSRITYKFLDNGSKQRTAKASGKAV